MHSIESLEEDDEKWKILPLKIAGTFESACVEFDNRIVVFGGHSFGSFMTCIFSKDGELE